MLKATITFILSSLISTSALSQDLNWRTVRIRGEGRAALCNQNTVFASYFDRFASFIFTSLGVNLPANSFGQRGEFGACQVRSRMTIPQGTYLTSLQQTISGGAIKSQGARGVFRSAIFMRTPPDASGRDRAAFPINQQIDPQGLGVVSLAERPFRALEEGSGEILSLYNDINFGPRYRQLMCQWTRARSVDLDVIWRLAVAGQRLNPQQTIILQIDSSDSEFELGMDLGSCR